MNYTVKRLQSSDIEDFKKLLLIFLEVFEDAPNNSQDDHFSILLEKQDFYAVAAYDGEEVIGGVTGYELPLPNGKKEIYLYDLAVSEKYRQQGVATALIVEIKVCAKKNGVSTLFVEAEAKDVGAVSFYKSLGAEQVSVEHFNINIE